MSLLNELKNIKSGKKELRNFGLLIAGVLVLIGTWLALKKQYYPFYYTSSAAAFLLISGLFFPIILWPIQKIWMGISVTIGYFISRIILFLFFFLIITPAGLLLKLFGQDLLSLKLDKSIKSYWIPKEKKKYSKDKYLKQF